MNAVLPTRHISLGVSGAHTVCHLVCGPSSRASFSRPESSMVNAAMAGADASEGARRSNPSPTAPPTALSLRSPEHHAAAVLCLFSPTQVDMLMCHLDVPG